MKKTYLLEVMLVFVMTVIAYGYFSDADWNTNSRMALVKAVVEENRFEVDSYIQKNFYTKDLAKFEGHYYSDKAIGSSLIGIEFYFPLYWVYRAFSAQMSIALFKQLISFLAVSLISAFLAPFIYSFARRISHHAGFALLITAIICIGTPFYKYSTLYYGHTLVGLFLFTVFFIWFNIKDEEKINPVKILISGYLLAYCVITEYPTAVLAFCLGLYILYILWTRHALFDLKIYLRLMLGAAIPIMLVLAYNTAVFHHPFKTGYGYELVKTFAEGQSSGLMGIGWPNLKTLFYMTFHTTMGIFWQSPVLLLAFVGWFNMWRDVRYRAEALLSFGVVSVYFLMMSGYYMWWGGLAFTPRSLVPILPFFAIPLVFLTQKWEKVLLILLAFLSIVQMLIVSAASNTGLMAITDNMLSTSISSMFHQPSIIYNVYLPNFIHQDLLLNRGQDFFRLSGLSSLIPLLLVEILLVVIFMKITSKSSRTGQRL